MKYIKLEENNKPVNYSIEQLFIDYPDARIYKISQLPDEQLLASYNVYPLITESTPPLSEDETAEEGVPEFRDGEWHQTWKIRKLNDNEIQKIIQDNEINLDLDLNNLTDTQKTFIANKTLQDERYNICKQCPSLTVLKTCNECGCIMPLKVKIANASCPLNKW